MRTPPSLVGFDPERVAHVRRLVKGEGVATDPDISEDARLLYVVAGLRCDSAGFISRSALDRAMRDGRVRRAAVQILLDCGHGGGWN